MTAFTAVLLYAAWTLLLPICYASIRVPLIAGGRRAPTTGSAASRATIRRC